MSVREPPAFPGMPRDAEGPVFAEPWQAQAFALVVQLNAGGAFTWAEWAQALAQALAGDPADDGSRYFEHWVAALEAISAKHDLAAHAEVAERKAEWVAAYQRTPHGKPIELASALRAPK